MKNNNQQQDALVYSRIPPHDKDLEEAVLGAILMDAPAYDIAREIINQPEIFFKDEHQKVYASILAIEQRGGKIDLLTVSEYLNTHYKTEAVNWAYFTAQLMLNVVSSAHVEEHANILLDKYRYREQIKIGASLVSDAYLQEQDSEDLINRATTQLMDLSALAKQDSVVSASTAVMDSMNEIETVMGSDSHLIGIDTGIKGINDITFGWMGGDVNIIAARPGQGKTSFALHLLMSTQKSHYHEKKSALFFSLEMSTSQLTKRMQSNVSGVRLDSLMKGMINNDELDRLNNASFEIGSMNFFIDDQAGLTIPQIRARSKRIKKMHGLDIIFVDYLQLIRPVEEKGRNRDQVIGEITRGLKAIAKDFNVPVIALSQMSRDVEKRGDTRPKLSDLRESGNIEQDASVVMFIYHYNDEMNGNPRTDIVIAKNRNGSVGDVPVVFDRTKQKWHDYNDTTEQFQTPLTKYDNPMAGISGVSRDTNKQINAFGDSVDDIPF